MKSIPLLAILLLAVLPSDALAQKESPSSPAPDAKTESPPTTASSRGASISGRVFIGDPAPSFVLDGSNSQSVRLGDYRGSWVVLVFVDRWQHLQPLKGMEKELHASGAGVVGLCHEKAHTLIGVAKQSKAPLLMLADVTGEISVIYGLYDFTRGQTEPGFFIVDPDGVVRMAVIGKLPPSDSIVRLTQFAITGM